MADSLEDLRDSAWQHVRRTIGDEFNYNDFLAGDDIYRMNASELAAVATMTADKMAKRWASEYEYVSIPLTGALGDWLRTKDDIESLVIEALERLRASEQGSSANPLAEPAAPTAAVASKCSAGAAGARPRPDYHDSGAGQPEV
jgi:hypothetical protein